MSDTETQAGPETVILGKGILPGFEAKVSDHGTVEARKAFNAAFALAQGGFGTLVKNRTVTIKTFVEKKNAWVEYTFRYADMQEIDAKTRPSLSANGLSTTCPIVPMETGVMQTMVLAHAEGFERTSEVFVAYGEEPKKFGALLSYMRRYMKQNLLDVAADDDLDEDGQDGGVSDGVSAAPKPAPAPRSPARKTATAPAPVATDAAGEPPIPPIDEAELQARATTRVEGAAEARQRAIEPAKVATPASAPAVKPADNPAAGVETQPERTVDPEDTGELCEPGEINFLLKRCKTRGNDMKAVLAELGMSYLNPETLANLTKLGWQRIKEKV